jgi:hypothetical protein
MRFNNRLTVTLSSNQSESMAPRDEVADVLAILVERVAWLVGVPTPELAIAAEESQRRCWEDVRCRRRKLASSQLIPRASGSHPSTTQMVPRPPSIPTEWIPSASVVVASAACSRSSHAIPPAVRWRRSGGGVGNCEEGNPDSTATLPPVYKYTFF